jgi:hypothetical protein
MTARIIRRLNVGAAPAVERQFDSLLIAVEQAVRTAAVDAHPESAALRSTMTNDERSMSNSRPRTFADRETQHRWPHRRVCIRKLLRRTAWESHRS